MINKFILASFISAAGFLGLTAGCNTVSVNTTQNIASPNFPPTQPDAVQILQNAPMQPHVRLGEINLQVEGSPTKEEIQTKLRTAAAKLGANAVVIVMDRTMVLGAYVTGPWWGRQVSPDTGRVIIGVPIHYIQ